MKKFVLFIFEFALLMAACCVIVEAQDHEEPVPAETTNNDQAVLCENLTNSLSMYLLNGLHNDQYLIETDIAKNAITKILENNCDLSSVTNSIQNDLFYKG